MNLPLLDVPLNWSIMRLSIAVPLAEPVPPWMYRHGKLDCY